MKSFSAAESPRGFCRPHVSILYGSFEISHPATMGFSMGSPIRFSFCGLRTKNFLTWLGIAQVALACQTGRAEAQGYHVLYSFCSQQNCADGTHPLSNGLIKDPAGNLFGMTPSGGVNRAGVVFELNPGQDGQYTYRVLYQFCSLSQCGDGKEPEGTLIEDTSGNLYGTTFAGGGGTDSEGDGEVFELSPNAGAWTLKVLYGFCPVGCAVDAWGPIAGLTYSGASSGALYDGKSPLFGSTYYVDHYAGGGIFELQLGSSGWSETVIYNFCPDGFCLGGSGLYGPVVMDGSGNLFGTTFSGGRKNAGVTFELTADTWSQTVLHSFCRRHGCQDGSYPDSGLAETATGQFVGMAPSGGFDNPIYCDPKKRRLRGCGTIFLESPGRKGGKWNESTLYTFCTTSPNCADGYDPSGLPVFDAQGNLYGTTVAGGNNMRGTIFEVSGSTLTTLYSFCAQQNCTDGSIPESGVIRDSQGNLFGTTAVGGANDAGVVFEITP
jgi:uncharacterized repeat protein (TIGR03803 family)